MTPVLSADFLRFPLAHRALHDLEKGRPENSLAAVQAAVAAGYGIEVDIQCSADNVAMVFHDYDLARLTDAEGRIGSVAARDLACMSVLGTRECIPTLAQVLDTVKGQVPLLIEIKDQDGAMGPDVGPLEAAVAEDLRLYTGPVAVMSFNPHSVMAMAHCAPDVARGLTTCAFDPDKENLPPDVCDRLRSIPDYTAAGCSFISHEWHDLATPRVAALKEQGAAILCWTVKSPQVEARAREIAHNITFEHYRPAFPA